MHSNSAFPLYLAGKQKVFRSCSVPEESLLDFYIEAFSLSNDLPSLTDPMRRTAYESCIDGDLTFLFVGYQTTAPDLLPLDAVCWKLTDHSLTILKSIDDRPSEMIELPIEWRWKKNVFLHGQKWEVGDFSIPQFFAPELLGRPARADFWISFNLFEDAQKEYVNGDQIQLAEYDPTWSRQYQKFSRWLKSYFGSDIIRRTEHFGSTAIPGIWAKPIVDILAEVPSFSRARERMLPKLTEEWEYCWYSNHMMLIKRDSFMGKRVLHVHLAPRDHDMWERLSFRDYLRSHPKEAAEYSRLKRQIVTQYSDDRERYTWSKGEFVRAVTRKALEWEGRNRQD